ncbi:uncharacterized protein LOC111379936 [Olea europaea var. sylvestris]|uniref:uncharacterized protein LOC111379936 n=1 Tax=Olea europaea var. sylvestris TaxID=158386 RepID=UPI000C1D61FF|nr:uncharacterized protein LOC111379936 [Olea europaea var. sylvestris]
MHFTENLNKEQQSAYDVVLDSTISSRVAASLLPTGQTGHSHFKIPLQTNSDMRCSVSKQSSFGQLLQTTKLIVRGEAPMINRCAFKALDKMLKDIIECELPFDGKVVVVILTPKNEHVDVINNMSVKEITGDIFTYFVLMK